MIAAPNGTGGYNKGTVTDRVISPNGSVSEVITTSTSSGGSTSPTTGTYIAGSYSGVTANPGSPLYFAQLAAAKTAAVANKSNAPPVSPLTSSQFMELGIVAAVVVIIVVVLVMKRKGVAA